MKINSNESRIKMILKLFLFSIILVRIDAKWQMYWREEFHSNQSIDTNKWYIQNEVDKCDGISVV